MDKLFKILISAAFFNTLSWIILIPVWQYPDEQAHFSQVQNFAELGYAPTNTINTSYEISLSEEILGTDRNNYGNNKFTYHPEFRIEYSNSLFGLEERRILELPKSARKELVKNESTLNPPLYYFLGSIFYKVFYNTSLFSRVYAIRIMSAIIFIINLFFIYKIGKIVFNKSRILPITLVSLVAFKPMLVFASTGILPDALTNLLFTIVLFLCIKLLRESFKISTLLFLGLTIFLGGITRQQFLISILIVLLPAGYILFKKTKYIKKAIFIFAGLIIFLIYANTAGLSIPIINNFRIADISIFQYKSVSLSSFIDHIIWSISHLYSEIWPWYWGVYKWLSLTLPPVYYQIINRLVIAALIGIVIKVVHIVKNRKTTKEDKFMIFLILASLIYYTVLIVWDYFFRLKNGFSFGIQGRYFFPFIVAHFTILVIGFDQISKFIIKKWTKYTIFVLIILMIIFNNISLFFVASSYYDVSSIKLFITQASQYKPLILKGDIILWILSTSLVLQAYFIYNFGRYIVREYESN